LAGPTKPRSHPGVPGEELFELQHALAGVRVRGITEKPQCHPVRQ
jgi:hypothetical protein